VFTFDLLLISLVPLETLDTLEIDHICILR
jgi:hypothetical protein